MARVGYGKNGLNNDLYAFDLFGIMSQAIPC